VYWNIYVFGAYNVKINASIPEPHTVLNFSLYVINKFLVSIHIWAIYMPNKNIFKYDFSREVFEVKF
jgi:hypothetical protein